MHMSDTWKNNLRTTDIMYSLQFLYILILQTIFFTLIWDIVNMQICKMCILHVENSLMLYNVYCEVMYFEFVFSFATHCNFRDDFVVGRIHYPYGFSHAIIRDHCSFSIFNYPTIHFSDNTFAWQYILPSTPWHFVKYKMSVNKNKIKYDTTNNSS